MKLSQLIDNGYEIIGSFCIPDDAVEMCNHSKGYYHDVAWCRYKGKAGQEDSFAVLCKNSKYFFKENV
jgi:hypothetical protein